MEVLCTGDLVGGESGTACPEAPWAVVQLDSKHVT